MRDAGPQLNKNRIACWFDGRNSTVVEPILKLNRGY